MSIRELKYAAVILLVLEAVTMSGCQSFTSQALDAEGVRYMNCGKTQQAEECFLKARATNPVDADACYNLAILEHKRAITSHCPDDFKRSEEYYRQALDRNPSHAGAYRGLAALYCDEGRSNDAFALLEHWNQQEIGSVEPKIELARLYHEYNRVDLAEQNLRQALAMDPQNVRALNSMAFIYEQKGMYGEASSLYCQSLQIMPSQSAIVQRQVLIQSQVPCSTCSRVACDTPSYPGVYSPCSPGLPQRTCCVPVQRCVCTTCTRTPACNSCGPQLRPIDTPSWALAQPYPPVAAQSFLGNNPASGSSCGTPAPVTQPTPANSIAQTSPVASTSILQTQVAPTSAGQTTSTALTEKPLPGKPVSPSVADTNTELY